MDFEQTIDALIAAGLVPETYKYAKTTTTDAGWQYVDDPHYRYAELRGLNVRLMVIHYQGKGHEPKVQADNERCFDKWSKAPLDLPLPRNDKQMRRLVAMLHHLGGDEGYELSNSYDYLDHNANPYHYQGKRWDKAEAGA